MPSTIVEKNPKFNHDERESGIGEDEGKPKKALAEVLPAPPLCLIGTAEETPLFSGKPDLALAEESPVRPVCLFGAAEIAPSTPSACLDIRSPELLLEFIV